jgi:hypothetical protein
VIVGVCHSGARSEAASWEADLEVERRIVPARWSIEKAVSVLATVGDSFIDEGP